MSRIDDNNGPLSLETPIDEDRVRRALGLKTGGHQQHHQQRPEQARQRHKFITDGEVPVVMLNRTDSETVHLRERIVSLEAAIEGERAAHAGTRRTLHELQIAHQMLQTQTRHNDMTQADMLTGAREARRAAEEALASMRTERVAPPEPTQTDEEPALAAPVRRGRKPRLNAAPAKDPKPVRWWTPSYRAKK